MAQSLLSVESMSKTLVDVGGGVEGSVGVGTGVCGCIGDVILSKMDNVGDKSVSEDLFDEEEEL